VITVTVLIVAVFAGWIGWRWRAINRLRSADRTALEELKHQYAAGEITNTEFERKLEQLLETDEQIDEHTERTLER